MIEKLVKEVTNFLAFRKQIAYSDKTLFIILLSELEFVSSSSNRSGVHLYAKNRSRRKKVQGLRAVPGGMPS